MVQSSRRNQTAMCTYISFKIVLKSDSSIVVFECDFNLDTCGFVIPHNEFGLIIEGERLNDESASMYHSRIINSVRYWCDQLNLAVTQYERELEGYFLDVIPIEA